MPQNKKSKALKNYIYNIGFEALQTGSYESCLNSRIKYFNSFSVRI